MKEQEIVRDIDMQMDRAIFDLNASVEATSLYILACALMDEGLDPTLADIRLKWSGTDESLIRAIGELAGYGVLEATLPLGDASTISINPREKWRGR